MFTKFLFTAVMSLSFFVSDKKPKELFDDFHTYYEKADFVKMDQLLSDNFVGLNNKGAVSFTKETYLSYMKEWNQVFKTKWNIVSWKLKGRQIISIEYDSDIFNDYFYGGKKTTQYTYTFLNDKIKSIRTDPTADEKNASEIFNNRFTKFYEWVYANYPTKIKYCTAYDYESAMEVKKLLETYLPVINSKKR
jgi:hypothetical protein